jgi:hypothetical protein
VRGRRGQVVLVAAAVVALALVPVLFSYLQLGYHDDVTASEQYTDPTRNAERFLERAVVDASDGVPADYNWGQRRAAVSEVRDRLAPRFDTLQAARVERGTVYRVRYNRSAARAYANEHCPGGPDRQFGPCRADRGVVVQHRAGETHVVAVAVDLTVTGERRTVAETIVVRVVGGVVRSW